MNNKQRKETTMRKIAMIVGLISVLATSANAGIWTHTPSYGGGYTSTYTPTWNYWTNSFN